MMTAFRKDDDGPLNRGAAPRLLVSVRSRTEASDAIAGGAQILDVKEPIRGSLGMADAATIRDIANIVRDAEVKTPLSVALGELVDWSDGEGNISLPDEVTYAKLGLSGLADRQDWSLRWRDTRDRFDRSRSVPLQWVAVAYADDAIAQSPSIDDVATEAIKSRCAGLLIDTFSKTGRTLCDYQSVAKLHKLASTCHSAGLFLAIAGSLKESELQLLSGANADIVAIRSAACENHDRKGAISARKIAQFRESLALMSGSQGRDVQTLLVRT